MYKKLDPLQKENYRPVSLLPHVSKAFERIIHKQITNYMTDKLAHSITGFRKSHGTQNSLVVILEKWKRHCKTEGLWIFQGSSQIIEKLFKESETKGAD